MCALFLPSDIVIRTGGCDNREGRVCRELAEEVVATGKQGEMTFDLHRQLGQPRGDRGYGESTEDHIIVGKSSKMARERRIETVRAMSHHYRSLTRGGLLASPPHAVQAGQPRGDEVAGGAGLA
jgi:hypothetical protein